MSIYLRSARPEDETFLFDVYASTRADEMALVGWDKAQQESFLRMQFTARQSSYSVQFPNADYHIVVYHGRDAGLIIVDRFGEDVRLIDIALLPDFRNGGVGSALLKHTTDEAERAQKPLKLHVEKFNRARHLYDRLGFTTIDESGIYLEMVWKPEDKAHRSVKENRLKA